jgi:hypothetical protein
MKRDLGDLQEHARALRDDPLGVVGLVPEVRNAYERPAVKEGFVHARPALQRRRWRNELNGRLVAAFKP